MRLLHVHGAPVITAVLQLDVSVLHQPVLSLASERSEVCGQVLNVNSTLGLWQRTNKGRSTLQPNKSTGLSRSSQVVNRSTEGVTELESMLCIEHLQGRLLIQPSFFPPHLTSILLPLQKVQPRAFDSFAFMDAAALSATQG